MREREREKEREREREKREISVEHSARQSILAGHEGLLIGMAKERRVLC